MTDESTIRGPPSELDTSLAVSHVPQPPPTGFCAERAINFSKVHIRGGPDRVCGSTEAWRSKISKSDFFQIGEDSTPESLRSERSIRRN